MQALSMSILIRPAPKPDRHIPYGADPLQFGHLRLPAGPGPHPVAVVIHGGFWRNAYDLKHIGHLCAVLTRAGLATWSLEYRRLGDPGGAWPGTFQDVARGTDHLRALAAEYPLDLARVITVGHSAGGHLACWLAGRHHILPGDILHSPDPLPLSGVVALAGVLDLARAWDLRLSKGVVCQLMGGAPAEMPERYATASPIEMVPLGVPQWLVHGTEDGNVPFEISETYHAAALAAGDASHLLLLPGAGHFEVIDPRSREWSQVQEAILAAAHMAS